MRSLPHTRSCFVCGEANPIGLNMRFETDDERVVATFVPAEAHAGFRQVVHGGLLATVLDEIMVWACAVKTGQFAFCAELKVRFQTPARPGETLMAEGILVANRKNKLFETAGTLKNSDGVIIAIGEGKYFALKAEASAGMADDFVGGADALRQIGPGDGPGIIR